MLFFLQTLGSGRVFTIKFLALLNRVNELFSSYIQLITQSVKSAYDTYRGLGGGGEAVTSINDISGACHHFRVAKIESSER